MAPRSRALILGNHVSTWADPLAVTIALARIKLPGRHRAARDRTARRRRALAVTTLVALGIGCSDEGSRSAGDGAGIAVSDAWARSSPAGVTDGAAYLTIQSTTDDELVGATVDADVAASVELHETTAGDGHGGGGTADHDTAATDHTGAPMTMHHMSTVDLPSGEAVVFEPGGLHVMLVGLARPLLSGSSFELTLTFADAAPQTLTVAVRDEAP